MTSGYHGEVMPDSGCEYSAKCLECPLPMCKHDTVAFRAWQAEELGKKLVRLRRVRGGKPGATVAQLAQRFGLTERSAYRIIKDAREARKHATV